MIALPPGDADDIADAVPSRPGFGSVRVVARIGDTEWTTSIYPDNTVGSFLLPVKLDVRRSEGLDIGDVAEVSLTTVDD